MLLLLLPLRTAHAQHTRALHTRAHCTRTHTHARTTHAHTYIQQQQQQQQQQHSSKTPPRHDDDDNNNNNNNNKQTYYSVSADVFYFNLTGAPLEAKVREPRAAALLPAATLADGGRVPRRIRGRPASWFKMAPNY